MNPFNFNRSQPAAMPFMGGAPSTMQPSPQGIMPMQPMRQPNFMGAMRSRGGAPSTMPQGMMPMMGQPMQRQAAQLMTPEQIAIINQMGLNANSPGGMALGTPMDSLPMGGASMMGQPGMMQMGLPGQGFGPTGGVTQGQMQQVQDIRNMIQGTPMPQGALGQMNQQAGMQQSQMNPPAISTAGNLNTLQAAPQQAPAAQPALAGAQMARGGLMMMRESYGRV